MRLSALVLSGLLVVACEPDAPPGGSAGAPETGPAAATAEGTLEGAGKLPIHYRVMGEGPDTVVVVHGGPGAGMHSVLPSVEPLARAFTVILYDQRGGGRSGLPADTADLAADRFVEDLEAVRRHFGLERMKLVSHSFGAVLVAEYARTHPNRVARIVLHGATGPTREEARRLALQTAGPVGAPTDTALARRSQELLSSLLSGQAEDPVGACREYEELGKEMARARGAPSAWRGTTCGASSEAVAYYYRYTAQLTPRTFGAWDYTSGALDQVDAPVLVVAGEAEAPGSVAQQWAWAAAYPDARLLLVPGSGKGAFDDAPELLFPALETFLGGGWPEQTRVPDR